MNLQEKKIQPFILITILSLCFITVLMQGIPALAAIPRKFIWNGTILMLLFLLLIFLYLHKKGKLTEERIVWIIITAGMILHCCYVLLSGLYDRQHDEGVYTGIATSQVNPGHIGYIEYIYKFHRLPDMNPYQLFSYYHPPLHYAISGIWLIFLTSLGMPEDLAFENLQALPLLYSGLLMLLTYHILKKTGAWGKPLFTGMLLIALHPALTIMSGSVNNDMLSTLLLACCIYTVLCWIREKSLKNLIFIALSIGFGMLCKINTAIIALPTGLLFLLDFIHTIRLSEGNFPKKFWLAVKNYLLFALVAGSIGLSWIVRNLVLFHVKPGISSATEASVMYTGNYGIWARIGIPAFSHWHFSFPFHPLSGDVIHNTWVIMFQTSLFAEVYPTELSGLPLMLCRFVYPLAILTALASAILFFAVQYRKWGYKAVKPTSTTAAKTEITTTSNRPKKPVETAAKVKTAITTAIQKQEALFLSSGYLAFLLSFAAFSIKYPYTCSSDFRYIVVCLIYIAIGLSDSGRLYPEKSRAAALSRITRIAVWVTLVLSAVIYMVWNQW